MLKIKMDR